MVIYLIGPRASGKSTLAAALARHLGCAWLDTDSMVLAASGSEMGASGAEMAEMGTVAGIVQREGWEGFRRRESAALRAAQARAASPLPHSAGQASGHSAGQSFDQTSGQTSGQSSGQSHCVIATGGGMVEDEDNRHFMRATGLVLRLNAPAPVLCARVEEDEARAGTKNGVGAALRPSLTGQTAAGPGHSRREMEEILRRRETLYAHAAHHELDAQRPVQDLCAQVLALLAEQGKG